MAPMHYIADQSYKRGCPGTDQPNLSCDAISAQAAIEQVRDSDASFWLSLAGLIIGSATLLAAGLAAKFARDAALHTEKAANEAAASVVEARRSAKVSEDALDLSRRQSRAELRPYVSLRVVDLHIDELPADKLDTEISVRYVAELTNVGSTPAYELKVGSNIKEIDWPIESGLPPLSIENIPLDSFHTLPQNTPDRITFSKRVAFSASKQLDGSRRICLVIIVKYTDVFAGDIYEIVRFINLANMNEVLPAFWRQGPSAINTTLETSKTWGQAT